MTVRTPWVADEHTAVFDIGAQAAGDLTLALRDAAHQAPVLMAPDGYRELWPVLCCASAFRYLQAVLRGRGDRP